ncbi:uncharacterized protein EAE97_004678 [Botrytis byssoidea]|uniref:Fungal N-terminal domain-containing protein n=1 Tax=Botrytis byssoidea TaxID=139641 RepID=A0A9P5IL08_9HELO|nr:uncharacterized protein EAE97_004678 [Botrytis byssoidea]KAF7945640.1 hypothetical protein EAE97_004678 [Botrytis byssoidea]
MEGLSSASAAFAVISLAVQLAESVKKLVEFWQAVEDAPGDICDLFDDLEFFSAALIQNQKKFAQHSPYDLIAKRILTKCQKRIEQLSSKLSPTMAAFTSSSSRKRKWAALKITLKNEEIRKMRASVGESLVAVQMIKQDAIFDMVEIALRHQEATSKGMSAIQEFVVQYSQNHRHMDRSTSLLPSYHMSILSAGGDTLDASLPSFYQGSKFHVCSQTTDTVVLRNNLSAPSGGVSVNNVKEEITAQRVSKMQSWEADGQTPIFSFRARSSSTKKTSRHVLGSRETVETKVGVVFYPAKWLHRLGVNVGIRMSATVDNGWMFTFNSFGAVPEDALIFDLCRQGSVAGVKILLDRGDASLECENPQGETPLWTAVHHGQIDVARFLIAAGAKNTADSEIWRNNVVLDARLKIAMIETLDVYCKRRDSIYGSIGRLSIFYSPSKRLDMTQEEFSDNMLCVFKALTPSLRTSNIAQFEYLRGMVSEGHEGKLIHWLISRVKGAFEIVNGSISSYSLLHYVIGARFLHRDQLSVKMIMERTANLHICHGYGPWGSYEPQTPTVLAMYDQDMFISWRKLLQETKQDMSAFIERELDAKLLSSKGWTKATLGALFRHHFNTPIYKGRRAFNGFPQCDRCGHLDIIVGMMRLKIDLEFRRQLREIRTGRAYTPSSSHTKAAEDGSTWTVMVDESENTIPNSQRKTWPPLPYRFVCSDKCKDGISVHDVFENDLEDSPVFPIYVSEEEKVRLEHLRLAEEEVKCPTYTMPGAFTP